MTEREIKLEFADAAGARAAIEGAGATVLYGRRLQRDTIFDTPDGRLRVAGHVLRLRDDAGHAYLTVKGPVQGGAMKVREERETAVADGSVVAASFEVLGLVPAFRYEKYRTEFALADTVIALDETPVGVFVEVEGPEAAILAVTRALGRTPADFLRESYRALFRARTGATADPCNMRFPPA
ncbi:MAG: class IV adenylate cyclase [Vicinamibacterales bacterium]